MRTPFFIVFMILYQQQTVTVVDQEQFKAYMAAGHPLIDVRTPEEFAQGHIEGAQNHNLYDANFIDQFKTFDKEKPLLLYCRSGNRSGRAAKRLDSLGFIKLYDLQGGFIAWSP